MKLSLFAALVAALSLTGCSDSVNTNQNQVSGFGFKALRENVNLFDAALSTEENDFGLKFSVKDGGVFLFTTNSDAGLENGINFLFTRTGNDLAVTVAAQGEAVDASPDLAGRLGDINGELNLKLTVHNGEGGSSHIIFKNAEGAELLSLHPSAPQARGPQNSVGNLFLRHPLAEKHSPGKGAGNRFGFAIDQASFQAMTVEKSDEH